MTPSTRKTTVMMTGDPWDRQPGESSQAFAAFAVYRDLDPSTRSLAKVGQELGKSTALMERWSARWNWVSRVEAHDAELDRQQLLAREKEIKEARQRHVQLARAVFNKVAQRLNALDANTIPVTTLDRLVKVATDLELRSLGEPTETTRQEHTGKDGGPIQHISLAEIREVLSDPEIRDNLRRSGPSA